MTKKERLEIYLKYKGLKPTVFAREIGISNSHVSEINNRNNNRTLYAAIRSKPDFLDCNTDWIATGEGEMLRQKESLPAGAVHEARSNHSFRADALPTMVVTQISRPATPDEQELLGYFDALCDDQKKALMGVIKAMAAGVPGKSPARELEDKDLTRKRSA
jgi:hypothetical protein